ncbi:organic hydroperoxide resistance protein [Pseudonocardia sp. EV170527-09]|uniref:organic hydroperoxide resistance protein n=1 Tax=Pseudonocardia sp. EV170527-09 TaxID=2603411 RepID=UPI0011F2CC1E|nr:organic hydroperoxide resistance protein [Pseudonocardia sp. EV170527-09]KAA1019081.1 organic hydroperoxide resistance protein [Pseudonocardia sp. EV170527-09]
MANYTTEATSTGGGRDGHIRSEDGFIDQDLKMPPELGGPGGATNPEQLFAAAYAACFHGALRLAARKAKVAVPDDAQVTATIQLQPDDVSFHVAADITAHLPGLEQSAADELVEAAHQVCPYSKATRGNIDVTLTATV